MVNVAILGFGTVGSGVAEVLDINAERIARTTGDDVRLKYIVDIRDFPGNKFEKYLTKDFSVRTPSCATAILQVLLLVII